MMRLAFITALLVTATLSGCDDQVIDVQKPRVIDGDTIELNGKYVRLMGIDAPELGQRCERGGVLINCGENAAFELHKLIALEAVGCSPVKGLSPEIVKCETQTIPLGENLLEAGLAVPLVTAPSNYQARSEAAKNANLGIWRGSFMPPDDWRAGKRLPLELESASECPILGLELKSKRVLVVPTDEQYSETLSNTAAIKKRFCSVSEVFKSDWLIHPVGAAN